MSGWLLLGIALTGLFLVPAVWLWSHQVRQRSRLARHLRSEPLVETSPLPPGPIQVQGTCTSDTPIRAPISGEPCIGYTLEVSVFVKDTDGGQYWDLARLSELPPFHLRVGEAIVAVGGDPAFLWLPGPPGPAQDCLLGSLPPDLRNRIAAQARDRYAEDRPDVIPRPARTVRLMERRLRPGDPVLVVGQASTGSGNRIGPRAGMPLLVIEGTRSAALARLRRDLRDPHLLDTLDALIETDRP